MFKIAIQEIGNYLQEVGREYGVTTGRRRRCGWLDLVVMKHSCLINGYDSLNLTKLDILDDLSEVKIAVQYKLDGEELPGFPGMIDPLLSTAKVPDRFFVASLELLERVEVVYVTLPGWKTPISSVTNFDDLPDNCKKYIAFIEEFLNVPIEWIGVGPGRESMLHKRVK